MFGYCSHDYVKEIAEWKHFGSSLAYALYRAAVVQLGLSADLPLVVDVTSETLSSRLDPFAALLSSPP